MVSPRRLARVAALQTLYEVDSTGHPVDDVLRRNLDDPVSESGLVTALDDPAVREFARSLVHGVLGNSQELDRLIVKSAPHWPIEQMSPVDKTILRLAIFEILFDNRVPLKAAINEAVELGKRFGSDSSSRFINGVLGTVASENQSRVRARSAVSKRKPSAQQAGEGDESAGEAESELEHEWDGETSSDEEV